MELGGNPFYLDKSRQAWVYQTLQQMTVEQKVGQLFCVMGQDYSPETLQALVAAGRVGGILFRPAPAETIRSWYRNLDAVAKIPLLKAANLEEGGAGGTTDGTLFGWPMTSAATNDDAIVQNFARLTAAEGRSIGINWTFSPVADLDLNFLNPITNVRSCGSQVEKVERFTRLFARIMQENGIAACAKHFPGDGVDFRDHHLHPTYNSLSAQEWYDTYGRVYRALIADGLASIMVGHIVQPNVARAIAPDLRLEDCLPASQSKEMLTGVLREQLGFNGVITTDATIMGGYCMAQERRKAVPASIAAGADMLVFTTDLEEDYGYLLDAVKDGTLPLARLDEAVTRILALKAAYCKGHEAPEREEAVLSQAARWQAECADAAVTLVKDRGGILPITPEKTPQIRLVFLGEEQAPDGSGSLCEQALDYLQEQGFAAKRYDPVADDLHGSGNLPAGRLTLYLANYPTASNNTTVRINWCRKHALDLPRFVHEEPSVFISLSNPYHLADVPRVPVYINTYSATRPLLLAALDKALGRSPFRGVSPVDAFCGLPDTRL